MEDSKISSQPGLEFEEREIFIPPLLLAAGALFVAWIALGIYAVHNPDVQVHLMRPAGTNVERAIRFQFDMAILAIPIQPGFIAVAGVVLVWIAFLRADWSDTLLFCGAVMLSSTVVLGGTEGVFHDISGHWYGSTIVCAGTATYLLCLLLARRARSVPFAALSLVAILYSVILPYYARWGSILDIAGGVLFAAAILCTSSYMAERAGVRPFARAE